MLLLLLRWCALARRQAGMVSVLSSDGLVGSDDDVVALEIADSQTAIVAVIYDRLDGSRRAVILNLLLPIRYDRKWNDCRSTT